MGTFSPPRIRVYLFHFVKWPITCRRASNRGRGSCTEPIPSLQKRYDDIKRIVMYQLLIVFIEAHCTEKRLSSTSWIGCLKYRSFYSIFSVYTLFVDFTTGTGIVVSDISITRILQIKKKQSGFGLTAFENNLWLSINLRPLTRLAIHVCLRRP